MINDKFKVDISILFHSPSLENSAFFHFASIVYLVVPLLVYNQVEYFNNGPIYKNEDIGLDMPLFIMINKIEIVKHMFLNLLTVK